MTDHGLANGGMVVIAADGNGHLTLYCQVQ
jgi:hypothetical protein